MNKVTFKLPEHLIFCKRCVMSNYRPASLPEFLHTSDRNNANYLNINSEGICDACMHNENKSKIDWEEREKQLLILLDKHRKNNGDYDCIVPGSGGEDSIYQSHILKNKYGMNPLTITWPPILYTDYGYKNFLNWINVGGFDNITFRPNGLVHKKLTKLAILNLLHPFQTFILGQKNLAPKIANKFGINLIFYGENEAEYGNPIADNSSSLRDNSFYTFKNFSNLKIAGKSIKELNELHQINLKDLGIYLPMRSEEIKNGNIEVHYLGYYLKWIPQEAYYYAVKNCDFKPRPFRSEGTYSKYNSIDHKIDDLHYYTTYIKFGLGRASYDSSQEIRNGHLNRSEAINLVKAYDGEYPKRYLSEVLEYLDISEQEFTDTCDKFRHSKLWDHNNGSWVLKKSIYD